MGDFERYTMFSRTLTVNTYPTTSPMRTSADRRSLWLTLALGAILIACGEPTFAQSGGAPKFREYEIKAAFLFNFMQFVEWPVGASTNADAPFVVGVLGDDPFGMMLDEVIKGETIRGRPMVITRKRRIDDLKDCHLIFVCSSERGKIRDILEALRGHFALTVSDADQFCAQGGMIGLISEGGRVHFEINQKAAEQCDLKISSKLLRLSRPAVN